MEHSLFKPRPSQWLLTLQFWVAGRQRRLDVCSGCMRNKHCNMDGVSVRGLVVDDGIKMDGMIQRRELPWGDEQGRWLKNGVDC